eukprot:PRCOL_00001155-RA
MGAHGDDPSSGRRTHKPCPMFGQADRRAAALERQRKRRRDLTEHARQLASAAADGGSDEGAGNQQQAPFDAPAAGGASDEAVARTASTTDGMDVAADGPSGSSSTGHTRLGDGGGRNGGAAFYAAQLMSPEWLLSVPFDLASAWIVSPRPEGRRMLLVAAGGTTIARTRVGKATLRHASALPGGRRGGGRAPADAFSILDCVFHEPTQTYFVLDCMCWKGYSLYDCAYEFRRWWLQQKLEEIGAAILERDPQRNKYPIVATPMYAADSAGLAAARSHAFGANLPHPQGRDGILLVHREAHYELGQTELALLWKDAHCSSYLVDTDAEGNVPKAQFVALRYRAADGACVTRDAPEPTALTRLPQTFIDAHASSLRDGMLLRFVVGAGGIDDLKYYGPGKRGRQPDFLSKILYQRAVYEGRAIAFETLCAPAANDVATHAPEPGPTQTQQS